MFKKVLCLHDSIDLCFESVNAVKLLMRYTYSLILSSAPPYGKGIRDRIQSSKGDSSFMVPIPLMLFRVSIALHTNVVVQRGNRCNSKTCIVARTRLTYCIIHEPFEFKFEGDEFFDITLFTSVAIQRPS